MMEVAMLRAGYPYEVIRDMPLSELEFKYHLLTE